MTYGSVTPSDSRANQTSGINHYITFKGVTNITSINEIQIDFHGAAGWFPTTGACSAVGLGKVGGTNWPYDVSSVPGSLTCNVSAIGVVDITGVTAGLNSTTVYGLNISGSSAILGTPAAGNYSIDISTLITGVIQETQSVPVPILGQTQITGSVTVPQPNLPGTVSFFGFGAPTALVTIQDGGSVVGTTTVLPDGSFSKAVTLAIGSHSVGLYQTDSSGRASTLVSFIVNVTSGSSQSFSNIYFSPTIALSATTIKQGDSLNIFGAVQPAATVQSTTNSNPITSSTTSDTNGNYNITLPGTTTKTLEVGAHSTSDLSTNGTLTSANSAVLGFSVVSACNGADINKDGRVNLTDLSILLFYWATPASGNPCADINKDGSVNLTDFSIMLFNWTG